jgi:uncharacterized protein YbgA (DUF1722 family)/uncharacterized protein YbbK (DUF523 family)
MPRCPESFPDLPIPQVPESPPRILVSECLLGRPVRYDGGHKLDPTLLETLGPHVEWVPVCPEVGCGLPVPRPPMMLAGDPGAPRLVETVSGADHTGRMLDFVTRWLESAGDGPDAFVCKRASPSCGKAGPGPGLFTQAFMARFPLVPVEEEGRLHDPVARAMFVERLFTLRRYRELLAGGRTRGRLVSFHADHKYLLLSHGRTFYEEGGRLVAQAKTSAADDPFTRYGELLQRAMDARPTAGMRADALHHMAGYLRPHLEAAGRAELAGMISDYREGRVPLDAPVSRLRCHVEAFGIEYLARQKFLYPHPAERLLRDPH